MSDVNRHSTASPGFDPRLFLRDEELDYGIALLLAGERALINRASKLSPDLGLPTLAIRVLLVTRFQPGQTVGELRDNLGATTPTLARILSGLSEKGYIERRPLDTDRRARALYLTHEGKRLTDPAAIAMRNLLRDVYRRAGVSAVAGARSVLQTLSA